MSKLFTLILVSCCVFILSPLASNAQRPDAPDYALRGVYTVGTQEFIIEDSERPLNLTVWYPALNPDNVEEVTTYSLNAFIQFEGNAISDALPNTENGTYPLVLFSHGSSGFRYQSTFYTEHLASHGFIVMAVDHSGNTILDLLDEEAFFDNLILNYAYRPQDILRVIDFAEILIETDEILGSIIDIDNMVLTGHSFGGYTAASVSGIPNNFADFSSWCDNNNPDQNVCFLLDYEESIADLAGYETPPADTWDAIVDERIQATVLLAPWNAPILDTDSLNRHTTPTMILVGTQDPITPIERDGGVIYDQLTSAERALIAFENGGHYIFVDECTEIAVQFGFYDSCSDLVWDMSRVHDLTNHYVTAFLLYQIYGDETALEAINPDAVEFTGVNVDTEGLFD